jgi:predicted amidohydrolase
MTVALITDVFFDDPDGVRLTRRLDDARIEGAELAVLPELPMDRWVPATPDPRPGDAEEHRGPRHRILAAAARASGLAVLGGAIVHDAETGARHNTALLIDSRGELAASYRKIHLPFEESFWEAAHYEPGTEPPVVIRSFPLALGLQVCSDVNRLTGCQLLAAQGAEVIVVPRATPETSWSRWRLVLRAAAVTSAAWVVSVNRPPEGVPSPIGGPSAVFSPAGEVVLESTEGLVVARLDRDLVVRARRGYPGYLAFAPEVYRDGWAAIERADFTRE